MTDSEFDISRIKCTLSELSRNRLPRWLANVLHMIENKLPVIPPPLKNEEKLPEYLYNH
jgi:hypothetical protein